MSGITGNIRIFNPQRDCAGMTFVELLLSMSIISITGVAAATLMFAVSRGTQTDKDIREIVTKHQVLDARFSASLRETAMVLDKGNDYIVIWIHDDDGSDTPNLGEIARLHYDSVSGWLNYYQAPVDLADASNTEYALTDDFEAITKSLEGDPDWPVQVWGTDISAFSMRLNDEVDPQLAEFITLHWTITVNGFADAGTTAVALRN